MKKNTLYCTKSIQISARVILQIGHIEYVFLKPEDPHKTIHNTQLLMQLTYHVILAKIILSKWLPQWLEYWGTEQDKKYTWWTCFFKDFPIMIRNMRHNMFQFNVTLRGESRISSWAQTNAVEIPLWGLTMLLWPLTVIWLRTGITSHTEQRAHFNWSAYISIPSLSVFTSPPLHLLPFMFATALSYRAHTNPVESTSADAFPARHSTPEVSVYIKHRMWH